MRREACETGPATSRQELTDLTVIAGRTCPPVLIRALASSLDDLIEWGRAYHTHSRSDVRLVRFLGRPLIIKRYNVLDGLTRIRRTLGPSPALRAWRAAWRLHALGLRTAEPLAYMERHSGPDRGVSYLVTEHVEAPDAATFFADPEIDHERHRAAALQLFRDIVTLHGAGYVHRDLKAANILIEDDRPVFIDLDTLRRPWSPISRGRGQHQDLARLLRTLERRQKPPRRRRRVARAKAPAATVDGEAC